MFTRRTATVTISAPDAACACAITACDGYLPVPTMRRDLKVRPAIVNGMSVNAQLPTSNSQWRVAYRLPPTAYYRDLPTPNEVHDLHRVAFADEDVRIGLALDDVQVVFNRHAARIDVELREERGHRQRAVELEAFAVEDDGHCNQTRPQTSNSGSPCVLSVLPAIPASQG